MKIEELTPDELDLELLFLAETIRDGMKADNHHMVVSASTAWRLAKDESDRRRYSE